MIERVPAHLACAITAALLLVLGTGASCERHGARKDPATEPAAQASAEPAAPTLSARPLTPFSPSEEAEKESAQAAEPAPPKPGDESPAGATAPETVEPSGPYVIAALGDSLTDRRSGGGGYLDVVRNACPKTVIDNYGKGGDMTNQMRRRFERDVLPVARERGYTHLVVYGGVNDLYSDETAGRSNERIEADLTAIYQAARGAGMRVVAITVSPWGGFSRYFTPRRAETTRLLNQWISRQTETGRVDRVVDSYPLLSCGTPEQLCPEYARPDGLHLTPQGQQILGQALLEGAFSRCE
jgi:lysophospholipase L1-like esterase